MNPSSDSSDLSEVQVAPHIVENYEIQRPHDLSSSVIPLQRHALFTVRPQRKTSSPAFKKKTKQSKSRGVEVFYAAVVVTVFISLVWAWMIVKERLDNIASLNGEILDKMDRIGEKLDNFWSHMESQQKQAARENKLACERDVAAYYSAFLQKKLREAAESD